MRLNVRGQPLSVKLTQLLLALQKYRNWIFGSEVTVRSDHNPLLYLTESVPQSAKLAGVSVTFNYRAGRNNVAADCLSRLK